MISLPQRRVDYEIQNKPLFTWLNVCHFFFTCHHIPVSNILFLSSGVYCTRDFECDKNCGGYLTISQLPPWHHMADIFSTQPLDVQIYHAMYRFVGWSSQCYKWIIWPCDRFFYRLMYWIGSGLLLSVIFLLIMSSLG